MSKPKKLQSFDDMFGNDGDSQELPITRLSPFKNHPFNLYTGVRLEEMVESIRELGVLSPIIVRNIGPDKYEILSGHNRVNAAKIAGLTSVPVYIKENISDEEAILIVIETNFMQRSLSDMLPSEKAKSFKMQIDALKETEKLNSTSQVGTRGRKTSVVGRTNGVSKNTISRYLRLSELIPPLLERVDKGEIKLIPAVELSYTTLDIQKAVEEVLNERGYKITTNNSIKLRRLDSANIDSIKELLLQEKSSKKVETIYPINKSIVYKYFKDSDTKDKINDIIEKALEDYFQKEKACS